AGGRWPAWGRAYRRHGPGQGRRCQRACFDVEPERMPTRTSHGPETLGGAFMRFVSTAAVLTLLASCASTPCVGDACPDACSGIACDEATEAPVDPTTPGRFTPCASNA